MELALGDQWLSHEREAWVWMSRTLLALPAAEQHLAAAQGRTLRPPRPRARVSKVVNQDHSLMQGVEVVDHLLTGAPERAYYGDMSDS